MFGFGPTTLMFLGSTAVGGLIFAAKKTTAAVAASGGGAVAASGGGAVAPAVPLPPTTPGSQTAQQAATSGKLIFRGMTFPALPLYNGFIQDFVNNAEANSQNQHVIGGFGGIPITFSI